MRREVRRGGRSAWSRADPRVAPFTSGDTIEALLASAAIPGVFAPVTVGDRVLVDGGLVANLPVLQAVELGATRLLLFPRCPTRSPLPPAGRWR